MGLNTNTNTPQYQMSNYLLNEILNYLSNNKIKINDFCKELMIPKYYLRKVMDPTIKMHTYPSFFLKIAKHCGIPFDLEHKLYESQPTMTH